MSDKYTQVSQYQRPAFKDQADIIRTVTAILQRIDQQGDAAIQAISQEIDGQPARYIEVTVVALG